MKTTRWQVIGKSMSFKDIEQILDEYVPTSKTNKPGRYDSQTTIFCRDDKPILKIVHKKFSNTYNAYVAY